MNLIGINGYIGSGKDTVGTIIQYLTDMHPYSRGLEFDEWQKLVRHGSRWEIRKFAGVLKQIASLLTGIAAVNFENQEFKKSFLGSEWDTYGILRSDSTRQVGIQADPHDKDDIWLRNGGTEVHNQMTVREFLQRLGTDAIRNNLHPNTWVNASFADYKLEGESEGGERVASDGGYYSAPSYRGNPPKWIFTDCRFPNEAQAIKDRGGIVLRINREASEIPTQRHSSETGLDAWNFDYEIDNNDSIGSLIQKVRNVLEQSEIITVTV